MLELLACWLMIGIGGAFWHWREFMDRYRDIEGALFAACLLCVFCVILGPFSILITWVFIRMFPR